MYCAWRVYEQARMGEKEHITVAETSAGVGGPGQAGEEVSLPVVELLTGRGFVTGKSGSGKSNSASVISEKLLDNGFGLLIVDIDGEYYGLKEEYEILHVGGDEECDIQVTTEHAERLASLALEQNVPIILDVSSYLDESEAEELLTAVARSLFAKAKKQKQPFLLLVEEVHEYIPENGSVGECGKMLIKIGKRGRKHGLGICGVSQRPADVKKDFITQCDWLLWHRLTWNNDTNVVRRILDSEYANAVENLDDGEGFLMTDWGSTVRRVQFFRKQTFDAGATPGLEDFERPDLKSVSDDLVSELQEISEEQANREDRIAELRAELDQKNSRIAELETELTDARDLRRVAEEFVDALTEQVEGSAPGRTERERMRGSPTRRTHRASVDPPTVSTGSTTSEGKGKVSHSESGAQEVAEPESEATEEEVFAAMMEAAPEPTVSEVEESTTADDADSECGPGDADQETADNTTPDTEDISSTTADITPPEVNLAGPEREAESEDSESSATDDSSPSEGRAVATGSADHSNGNRRGKFSAEEMLSALRSVTEGPVDSKPSRERTPREEIELSLRSDAEFVENTSTNGNGQSGSNTDDRTEDEDSNSEAHLIVPDEEPLAVRELKADIAGMETKTRKMLSFYREYGASTALNAHFAAGGDGDRTKAYARNRDLRTRGLVEHVGRGKYTYRLRDLLGDELGDHVDEAVIDDYATTIEETTLGG